MDNNDLKKAGLKATIPRVKILEVLEQQGVRHISAEDMYKHLSEAGVDIGLATVYRTLSQFEAAGIVKRHHFEGSYATYELNEGPHHDHILCVECGRVEEFIDEVIESRQKVIAEKAGFDMTDHNLCIYGICAGCKSKKSKI